MAELPAGFKPVQSQQLPEGFQTVDTPDQSDQQFSVLDQAIGALENLRSIGFSAAGEPVAGISGLVAEAVPGGITGAEMVEAVQTAAAELGAPQTEAGIAQQRAIGEFLQPVGETLESVRTGIGDYVFETTGSPLLASISTAAPDALLALVGSAPVAKAAKNYNTATKQTIRNLLKDAPQSKKAGQYIIDGAGRVKTSKAFSNAVSQGFDEATMASIKGASQADKAKMGKMLTSLERGLKDARTAIVNRPADVVGRSALERVNFLKRTNRQAGKEIEAAAQGLKGKQVDYSGAVNNFIDDLDQIGIKLDAENKPIFSGSY